MQFLNLTSNEIKAILVDGLGISRQQAFEFWLKRLQEIYGSEPSLNNQIQYVAAMLAKFSQLNLDLAGNPPLLQEFARLAEIKNSDQLNGQPLPSKELENAGKRFLYLSGFEEKYVFKQFNRSTVSRIGSILFLKAVTNVQRDLLLMEMSDHFMDWQHRLAFIHYQLTKNADLTLGTKLIISTSKI